MEFQARLWFLQFSSCLEFCILPLGALTSSCLSLSLSLSIYIHRKRFDKLSNSKVNCQYVLNGDLPLSDMLVIGQARQGMFNFRNFTGVCSGILELFTTNHCSYKDFPSCHPYSLKNFFHQNKLKLLSPLMILWVDIILIKIETEVMLYSFRLTWLICKDQYGWMRENATKYYRKEMFQWKLFPL